MAAISAFRVTQHSQIFSLFFRNQIQCIALYQLHSSQGLLNLRRGYYSNNTENILEVALLVSLKIVDISRHKILEIKFKFKT